MAIQYEFLEQEGIVENTMASLSECERDLVASLIVLEDNEVPVFLNSLVAILSTTLARIEILEGHIRKIYTKYPDVDIDKLQ